MRCRRAGSGSGSGSARGGCPLPCRRDEAGQRGPGSRDVDLTCGVRGGEQVVAEVFVVFVEFLFQHGGGQFPWVRGRRRGEFGEQVRGLLRAGAREPQGESVLIVTDAALLEGQPERGHDRVAAEREHIGVVAPADDGVVGQAETPVPRLAQQPPGHGVQVDRHIGPLVDEAHVRPDPVVYVGTSAGEGRGTATAGRCEFDDLRIGVDLPDLPPLPREDQQSAGQHG
jgi:hypothetical protein